MKFLLRGGLQPRGPREPPPGSAFVGISTEIGGAKWEVTRFSPIWVMQNFSMAQRVCWKEAPTQTDVFASGNCEIGRLLIGSYLGRSNAEFVRRLLGWRPGGRFLHMAMAMLDWWLGVMLFGLGPKFGFEFGFGPFSVDSVRGGVWICYRLDLYLGSKWIVMGYFF